MAIEGQRVLPSELIVGTNFQGDDLVVLDRLWGKLVPGAVDPNKKTWSILAEVVQISSFNVASNRSCVSIQSFS